MDRVAAFLVAERFRLREDACDRQHEAEYLDRGELQVEGGGGGGKGCVEGACDRQHEAEYLDRGEQQVEGMEGGRGRSGVQRVESAEIKTLSSLPSPSLPLG